MTETEQRGVEGDDESPLTELVSGAVVALTLLVAFGLLFAGVSYFWVAFPVGFAGVLPMARGAVKYYQRQPQETAELDDQDAQLAELRQRYARGELTDEEFESQVERLLETESVSDARAYTDRIQTDRTPANSDQERA